MGVSELMIVALAIVTVIAVIVLNRRRSGPDSLVVMQQQIDGLRQQVGDSLNASSQLMNQQLHEINQSLVQQLQSINQQIVSQQQSVGARLDAAAQVVSEVQNNLGSLTQATQRVFEVGKDIASLQEILRAPKLRGVLGELFLSDLLQQMLPRSHFKLQYKFKSGEAVDAVVCLGQGMVSVDSKFPLENFRRVMESGGEEERRGARRRFLNDVKKHIDSVASKYILPDEGTYDFALMYIPAENVYYEMIIRDQSEEGPGLSAYALERKVIPVSPNSFYAYLQAIVLGLKGLRVEKNVRQIMEHLSRLHGDMQRFRSDFDVVGRHITNLKNKYDDAERKINAFEEKLISSSRIDTDASLEKAGQYDS